MRKITYDGFKITVLIMIIIYLSLFVFSSFTLNLILCVQASLVHSAVLLNATVMPILFTIEARGILILGGYPWM